MKIGVLFIISLFISSLYMIDIVMPYNLALITLFGGYAYNLQLSKKAQTEAEVAI